MKKALYDHHKDSMPKHSAIDHDNDEDEETEPAQVLHDGLVEESEALTELLAALAGDKKLCNRAATFMEQIPLDAPLECLKNMHPPLNKACMALWAKAMSGKVFD